MCTVYGYLRVSTKKQTFERQRLNIERAFPDKVIIFYEEKESGKNNARPVWGKLQKKAAAGDAIIFDSVSRMGRDAAEGIKTYLELYNKGVSLYFVNEPYINTDLYTTAKNRQIDATIDTGSAAIDNYANTLLQATNQLMQDLAAEQIRVAFEQAEKEGRDISERVKAGMLAKESGEKISAARSGKTYTTTKAKTCKAQIAELSRDFDGVLTDAEVMRYVKVARNTYYKYKNEIKIKFFRI